MHAIASGTVMFSSADTGWSSRTVLCASGLGDIKRYLRMESLTSGGIVSR